MPSQLQEYEAGQLSVGREDGQETKEGQSQELNNGVEAEFEEAPQATNGQVRGGTTHKFQGQSVDYTHRNILFLISFHFFPLSDAL